MSGARPIRVGLLHFTAPPIIGGVEAIIGHQAAALTARGFQVVIITGRGGIARGGIRVARLPQLDSKYPPLLHVNAALRTGTVPAEFEQLSKEIEVGLDRVLGAIDVCIVHNALTLHFNLPLTAALHRLAARRVTGIIAWCHDLAWTNPLYRPLLRDRYPWSLLRQPAPGARYVLVSEDRRRDFARLSGLDPSELIVIPAGVDPAAWWGLSRNTRELLDAYGLMSAEPFLLLPVRITRRKNIEYAIRVVDELRTRGFRPKLLVTGPVGPHDSASRRYCEEILELRAALKLETEVILLQAGPGPRRWKPSARMMHELYRAADLLLIPSSQEGFGIPVLEAGVAGLPVFCSDIPAFRETAAQWAEFFALASPPSEVAARIARFLAQDARYNLRRRILRDFNWTLIYERQIVPLLQVVARPPAAREST